MALLLCRSELESEAKIQQQRFTVLEPGESKGLSWKEKPFGFAQKVIRQAWMSTIKRRVFHSERIILILIMKLQVVPGRSVELKS